MGPAGRRSSGRRRASPTATEAGFRLTCSQQIAAALADADSYISGYNIWMHHLLDADGRRLFPAGKRLITHWNLRDELKAQYAEKDGLARQRMIAQVMERIVDQTIPAVVVDNPHVDWQPYSNQVTASAVQDSDRPAAASPKITAEREPDTRYAKLLGTYRAARLEDPYSPAAPSLIARRFDFDRELPEARVEAMLEQIVGSPLVPRVAKLIERRLERPLEPFDIWYNGFLPRGKYTEAELDAITKKKYPTAGAFAADIPAILVKLGFSQERAGYLASNIEVDPSRGAGHAWGAQRRGDKAHLRTRVGADGMDYKGYNIAVHELGHNVEQTFSLNEVPYNALEGVPNTAFTEALAFVFQARDLELLGLAKPDATSEALTVLDDFWGAYEIGGVALVDMRVWRWMYAHPDATPAELRDATLGIAREVWNRFYAPVFGRRDVVLLGIYSHMIDSVLYLPDYPVGAMIARQVEQQIATLREPGRRVRANDASGTPDSGSLDEESDRSASGAGSAAPGCGACAGAAPVGTMPAQCHASLQGRSRSCATRRRRRPSSGGSMSASGYSTTVRSGCATFSMARSIASPCRRAARQGAPSASGSTPASKRSLRGEMPGAYCELNFSPSEEWAAFGFSAYREGMSPISLQRDPSIAVSVSEDRLALDAIVGPEILLALPGASSPRLALSAVVEETDGRLSYWALTHPAERPDFHHRDGFVLPLEHPDVDGAFEPEAGGE